MKKSILKEILISVLLSALCMFGETEVVVAATDGTVTPEIEAVTPNKGPESGGTWVNVIGEDFRSGAVVRFGSKLATEVTFVSSVRLLACTPSGSAGAVDVVVINPGGQWDILPSGFTYRDAGSDPPNVDAGNDDDDDEGETVEIYATFIDTANDTHTAIINWGDGTITEGVVTYDPPPVGLVLLQWRTGHVAGSHVYEDNGEYLVTVIVTDQYGASGSDTLTMGIDNEDPDVESLPDKTAVEGSPTISANITFTDPGILDTHIATIEWGDGSTDTIDPAISPIATEHAYPSDDGYYLVKVTVADDDGDHDSKFFNVTVSNENPNIPDIGNKDITEGAPVADLTFIFTDSGALDTHTATITWGDGAIEEISAVTSPVSASHIYATKDDAQYTVNVSVQDDNGGSHSESFKVTVANNNPVITPEDDQIIKECDTTVNISVNFTDPGTQDTHTAAIKWGDGIETAGQVSEKIVSGVLVGTVTGSHTYARDNGVYTVTVTVEDDDDGSDDESFTVTVKNEKPVISTNLPDLNRTECDPSVSLEIDFTNCGILDTHTAKIDWNDGTVESAAVTETNGAGTASGSHTYVKDDGVYTVVVSVEDDDGGVSQETFTVTVENGSPTITTPTRELTLSECDPVASLEVEFTDCSHLDTHTATVDWGDGVEEAAKIEESGGSGKITASHEYAKDDGTYKILFALKDDDGGKRWRSFEVVVENERPTITTPTQELTLNECDPSVSLEIDFTDCGILDTHTATVDWGDDVEEAAKIEESGGSGKITASHEYAKDDGTYKILFALKDDDGGKRWRSFEVVVKNESPTITTPTRELTLSECDPVTSLEVEFTDCSHLDTHTVTVDWGDGVEEAAKIEESGGSGKITASYEYARDDGAYTILFTLKDDDGGERWRSFDVVVENENPVIESHSPISLSKCNPTLDLLMNFTNCGSLDTHTAVIFWGDGAETPGNISEKAGAGTVTGSHTYAAVDAGVYKLTVQLKDDDGGICNESFDVVVVNQGPTIDPPLEDVTISECEPTVNLLATFTSCSINDSHTATIDWGDGTQTQAKVSETIVSEMVSGTATGSHTYVKDDGVYAVTVTVENDDGASSSGSFDVIVENEMPKITTKSRELTLSECDPSVSLEVEFTDCSPLDTHTVTVDWGDGVEEAAKIVESGGSGKITASHEYARDDGTYTILFILKDDDGGERWRSFDVVVENEIPKITTKSRELTLSECDPSVSLEVEFTDCSPLDTHTATVDWGDSVEEVAKIEESGGSGKITASHEYSKDDGTYRILFALKDDDGGERWRSFDVVVENAGPIIDPPLEDVTVSECEPTVNLLAKFTSCSINDIHTATIDWGDGTQTQAKVSETIVSEMVSGTVSDSHTYVKDDGVYAVTVTVENDDGASSSGSFDVIVENEIPKITTPTRELTLNECDPVASLEVEFTDCSPLDTHTATVDWGDGVEEVAKIEESGGSGKITASHEYAKDDGTYRILFTLKDDDGGERYRSFEVVVENERPTITTPSRELTLSECDPSVSLEMDFTDCSPLDTHTATVDWGDGVEEVAKIEESGGSGKITASHEYAKDDGTYRILFALKDDDGGERWRAFDVVVENSNPVIVSDLQDVTLSNQNPTLDFEAEFTDCGILDTHTAKIDWGDGVVESAQVEETGGSGTITGSHSYADAGSYEVTVTVSDDDDGSGSATITVVVSSAPPPVVTAVSPNSGGLPDGTKISISGRDFQTGATVKIGNSFATGVVVDSPTNITAVTPAGSKGAVDVTVINPDEQKGTLADGFTYVASVAKISIYPQKATVEAGQTEQFSIAGEDSVGDSYSLKNTDVNWSTADAGVGSINSGGLFTAVTFGTTTVIAVLKSNSSISAEATVEITDTEPPEVISEQLFPDVQDKNVPVTASVPIVFSELINMEIAADDGISVNGGNDRTIEGEVEFNAALGILYFTPYEPFKDEETITVVVTTVIEDPAGNNLQAEFQTSFSTGLSIWPGDSNNDGVVDIQDIIPLGQYWGMSGQSRGDAISEWELQPAVAWTPDKTATYADTNGDGEVNAEDIMPIATNWRLSHSLNSLAPSRTVRKSAPENPKLLDIYEAMYDVLENAPSETEGVRTLKKTLRELTASINRRTLPHENKLLQNYPNPFNPETWIPYQLAEDASVCVKIYDMGGALVRTLEVSHRAAGYYLAKEDAAYWNGTNDAGETVASGIYFYTISAGDSAAVKKLTVLR